MDNGWYIKARRAAIDSTLRSVLSKDDFDDMVSPLRPRQNEYKELLKMLAEYRKIEAKGGWATILRSLPAAMGRRGPLGRYPPPAAKGDGRSGEAGGKPIYDDKVAKAVARFQERHGITADGTVNPKTWRPSMCRWRPASG